MPVGGFRLLGLANFDRSLAQIPREWAKVEREVLKTIADEGARRAQAKARGLGGVQAKSAKAIRGTVARGEARIGVTAGRGVPMAAAAFWGAKRHTGWYAKPQYRNGPAQHDPWVGNGWDVAVAGTGPYAINDALAEYLPELLDDFREGLDDAFDPAFT